MDIRKIKNLYEDYDLKRLLGISKTDYFFTMQGSTTIYINYKKVSVTIGVLTKESQTDDYTLEEFFNGYDE